MAHQRGDTVTAGDLLSVVRVFKGARCLLSLGKDGTLWGTTKVGDPETFVVQHTGPKPEVWATEADAILLDAGEVSSALSRVPSDCEVTVKVLGYAPKPRVELVFGDSWFTLTAPGVSEVPDTTKSGVRTLSGSIAGVLVDEVAVAASRDKTRRLGVVAFTDKTSPGMIAATDSFRLHAIRDAYQSCRYSDEAHDFTLPRQALPFVYDVLEFDVWAKDGRVVGVEFQSDGFTIWVTDIPAFPRIEPLLPPEGNPVILGKVSELRRLSKAKTREKATRFGLDGRVWNPAGGVSGAVETPHEFGCNLGFLLDAHEFTGSPGFTQVNPLRPLMSECGDRLALVMPMRLAS